MTKLFVHYVADGTAISDFNIETAYEILKAEYNNNEGLVRYYSTSNIFDRIRLGIVQGELDHNEIIFVFENNYIRVNKYGMIPDWPKGFLDFTYRICGDLLRASVMKKQQERLNG